MRSPEPDRLLAALLCCLPLLASAGDMTVLNGTADAVSAQDWRILRLQAAVELTDSGIRGNVRIGKLIVPAAEMSFDDIDIDCGAIRLSAMEYRCDNARLTANFPGIGRHTVPGTFAYDRKSATTRFELPRIPVAGSTMQLSGVTGETETSLAFDGERFDIEALMDIANGFGAGLDTVTASGFASASGTIQTGTDGSVKLTGVTELGEASISNASGTAVTDALQSRVELTAERRDGNWRIDLELRADRGEAYFEPVYANLSQHAVQLGATGVRTADFRTFELPDFRLRQEALVSVGGGIRIALPRPGGDTVSLDGNIDIDDTSVAAVYTGLLQVFAAGTVLGDLETAGRFSGNVSIADNALTAARLNLQELVLDDKQRRFALYGLSGQVNWPGPDGNPADAASSTLRWDSATAYNIPLGGSTLDFRLGGNDVELLSPLRLPTMGGALLVNRLAMNDYGSDNASGLLDAELEPIQLGQLTGAFGWPAFSGSLSGRLPLLQYEGNAMTVGGSLIAQAFDGDIEVANLRLEQPFGRVPRLYGDLRLQRLDLERITNTFSFGLIQGRLSGDVTGLDLQDWRPVAMDLHLYTPADDRTRHRISQRAVENLASVGGSGAAAALSSGLLKFFEVFAYDRIGLRCILKDGVCTMSGAGSAGDGPYGSGYYIVKGSGLPRIDVIGYRRQVSWERLVQQLAGVTRSEGPVVR